MLMSIIIAIILVINTIIMHVPQEMPSPSSASV